MTMLSDHFKMFRPLEVEDEFFGHLKYIRLPQDCISYWEATRLFTPTAREIELFVDAPAPELPPSELQRQFFLTVEQHYSRILVEVEAVLRPHFEEWARKTLSGPFSTEFTMTSFSIPNVAIEEAHWDMCFESITEPNHLFMVEMQGTHSSGASIIG